MITVGVFAAHATCYYNNIWISPAAAMFDTPYDAAYLRGRSDSILSYSFRQSVFILLLLLLLLSS